MSLSRSSPTVEPSLASRPGLGGHPPLPIQFAFELVVPAPAVGLPDRLPADPQDAADGGPRVAFVAGCEHQKIPRTVDAVLGVSQRLERLQRVLRTSQRALQPGNGAGDLAAGFAAFGAAHVNAHCHAFGLDALNSTATTVDTNSRCYRPRITRLTKFSGGVIGAPSGPVALISSHISADGPRADLSTTEKKTDPRRANVRVHGRIRVI